MTVGWFSCNRCGSDVVGHGDSDACSRCADFGHKVDDVPVAQPAPREGRGPPIHDLLIAEILARKSKGLATYGTPLQAGNGRDALRDALEEALDLAAYLRQAIAERDGK